ncbi:MAG: hypothetical protein K0R54_575 [Clostridiaceae bacterium]|jgi:hypothetical protein|nr:hypothetical protein [Clostridiaceae bacterium]
MSNINFSKIIYENILINKDYLKFKEDICEIQDNIETNHDIDKMFYLLKYNRNTFFMRENVGQSLCEFIYELLAGLDKEDIAIEAGYYHCVIHYPYFKIPMVEYLPNHSSSPEHSMFEIDFSNKTIIDYDGIKEFTKAQQFQENIILEKERKLVEMDKSLEYIKEKFKSKFKSKLLKFLFSNKSYYEDLEKLIKSKEQAIEDLREQIVEAKNVDYIDIYEKITNIKSLILPRLQELQFVIEKKIVDESFK